MSIQHKNINNADLHDPKDFSIATVDTIPSKNSSGLLEWIDKDNIGGPQGPQGPVGPPITTVIVTDINNPTELNALSGSNGDIIKIIQNNTGHNFSVIYDFDSSTTESENIPFFINGSSGMWIMQARSSLQDFLKIANGYIKEGMRILITSDGVTVTASLDNSLGGDLILIEDGIQKMLDVTPPLTLVLTTGSDTNPILNYIYIENDILAKSTSGFPLTKHHPIAAVLVQSAASVQINGLYKLHKWENDYVGANGLGELSHAVEWIRVQHATWKNGVLLTPSVGVDIFDISVSSGEVYQFHRHIFPARDTSVSDFVFVVNDFTTSFNKVIDLSTILTDSLGVTLVDTAFNLVIWGVISESAVDSHLFVNLPSGSYLDDDDAINDVNKFNNFNIPAEFKGVGFLIARLTVLHDDALSTWSILQNEDLRSQFPSIFVGGAGSIVTIFEDGVFRIRNTGDITRQVELDCSLIATSTTRIQQIPNQNGLLAHRNNDNNFSIAQTFISQFYSTLKTLTDGATINTDMNTGNIHTVTIAGDRILANPTNLKAGASYIWIIIQDAVGNRDITFGTVFKFENGTVPILTKNTANAIDILSAISDGTNVFAQLTNKYS